MIRMAYDETSKQITAALQGLHEDGVRLVFEPLNSASATGRNFARLREYYDIVKSFYTSPVKSINYPSVSIRKIRFETADVDGYHFTALYRISYDGVSERDFRIGFSALPDSINPKTYLLSVLWVKTDGLGKCYEKRKKSTAIFSTKEIVTDEELQNLIKEALMS